MSGLKKTSTHLQASKNSVQILAFSRRLLRYLLLHHTHPKLRPKQHLIKAYLDLLLGWGCTSEAYDLPELCIPRVHGKMSCEVGPCPSLLCCTPQPACIEPKHRFCPLKWAWFGGSKTSLWALYSTVTGIRANNN